MSNRQTLVEKSEHFVYKVEQGDCQREVIFKQLEGLKSKLNILDKNKVSMNEIYAILNDAQTMEKQATHEFKKIHEVQEELKQLNSQWKQRSKQEEERQEAVFEAKKQIQENAEKF